VAWSFKKVAVPNTSLSLQAARVYPDLEMGSICVVDLLQEYGNHCVNLHEGTKDINLRLC